MKNNIPKLCGFTLLFFAFLFCISIGISSNAIAGVVAPSLIKTQPSSAASVGWRKSSSVLLGLSSSSYSKNGLYKNDKPDKSENNIGEIGLNLATEYIAIELNIEKQENTEEGEFDSGISCKSEDTMTTTFLNLGGNFNDKVSLGIQLLDYDYDSKSDASFISLEANGGGTYASVGASVNVAEYLYLGMIFSNARDKGTTGDIKEVSNTWTETSAGIAVRFGQEDETQYMVEFNHTSSPETKSDADSDKEENTHHASTANMLTGELKLSSGLFFLGSYLSGVTKTEEKRNYTLSMLSGGWEFKNGLSASGYFRVYESDTEGGDDNDSEKNTIGIYIGYSF